ncbi:MAG: polysaccharide deacetylase family protein [Pseudomonadales bacterium]|nr:polysaccharide deacetylase family protein [Pseudomonadales bacterium]
MKKFFRFYRWLGRTLLQSLSLLLLATSALAVDHHAVVLLYHHVSEQTPASTSVTPVVLERHLEYLAQQGFTVWPLGRVMKALSKTEAIPEKTVVISFDDAYLSVYTEAFPRFQQRGWPFTLFVSTEAIDNGYKNYLNWDQIRELAAAGVEIGNHSHSHAHLVRRQVNESTEQWQQRVMADIHRASARLEKEIGITTNLFAYPYGEYSPDLKNIVGTLGYLGIAQQSGAIGVDSDLLAVPRFPMATGYSDMKRFATSVNALPLPVRSVIVDKPGTMDDRINQLQLTLAEGSYDIKQLACYSASGEVVPLKSNDDLSLRITLNLAKVGSAGRNKINCTAPAKGEKGVYYWYSYQWLMKKADGRWYEE